MTRFSGRPRLLVIWMLVLLGVGFVVARQQADARADLEARFALRVEAAETFVHAYLRDLEGEPAAPRTLRAFLTGVHPARSARVAIVDGWGQYVAVSDKGAPEPGSQGRVHVELGITGTPWRVLASVEESELFAPIGGIRTVVPWLILAALAVLGLVTIELLLRRRAARRELFLAREQAEAAFQHAAIGMALIDVAGAWSRVNDRLSGMIGGTDPRLLVADDAALLRRLLDRELPSYTHETQVTRDDGTSIWCQLSVALVRDTDGSPLHFIVQAQDISEPRRLRAELEELATRDPLTGLWNRRRFGEELAQRVALARRHDDAGAVLLVDVDRFKPVNDTYGHQAGDELLRAIAQAISGGVRAADSVARIGGDEFAVLLAHAGPDEARAVAEGVAEAIRAAAIDVGGRAISTTASIGVAQIDGEVAEPDEILVRADMAMYAAKQQRPVAR